MRAPVRRAPPADSPRALPLRLGLSWNPDWHEERTHLEHSCADPAGQSGGGAAAPQRGLQMTQQMHPALVAQLQRLSLGADAVPDEAGWTGLLNLISRA
jgi:hypothetical protein